MNQAKPEPTPASLCMISAAIVGFGCVCVSAAGTSMPKFYNYLEGFLTAGCGFLLVLGVLGSLVAIFKQEKLPILLRYILIIHLGLLIKNQGGWVAISTSTVIIALVLESFFAKKFTFLAQELHHERQSWVDVDVESEETKANE